MSTPDENNVDLALWLSGELDPEKARELEASEDLADLGFVLEDIAQWSLPPMDLEAGYQKVQEERKDERWQWEGSSRKQRVPMVVGWAAAILLVLGGLWLGGLLNPFAGGGEVVAQTGPNETLVHEFPDGSVAQLNASTKISYNENSWDKARTVTFDGQALFSVEKGSPFTVTGNNGTVSVLGTEFDVKDRAAHLGVNCYEGHVLVTSEGKQVDLTAGEGVLFRYGRAIELELSETEPDWLKGENRYSNVALSVVAEDLKARFGLTMNLPDQFADEKFTGRFLHGATSDDRDKALRAVFGSMGISYAVNDRGTVTFSEP